MLYATIFSCLLYPKVNYVYAETINEQLVNTLLQHDSRIVPALASIANLKEVLSQGLNNEHIKTLAQTLVKQSGKQDMSSVLDATQWSQKFESALKTKLQQGLSSELNKYAFNEQLQAALGSMIDGSVLSPENSQAPKNYGKVLNMTATAYAPGVLDNGHWNNLTYMGGTIHHGVAAVDPSVIPMGSKLWVEGYGEAVAVDQGSAIKGNRIDLAFDNRQDALDYGIKNLKVYVLN
jgi:3D (Asp-Asp-Asp) domain-containing protein